MRPALYPVLFRRPLRGGPDLDLNFAAMTVLDPRVTYTGASLATLTDATGAIAYKPHNLLTYSEDFTNAAWTQTNLTVTANAAADPNGSTTMDLLVESASSATHIIRRDYTFTAGVFTASVYAKQGPGAARNVGIIFNTAGIGALFDATTGAVVVNSGATASATNIGGGIWRFSITATLASGTDNVRIYLGSGTNWLAPWTGDGASGAYVWGAQLNVGPLQPYYPTTSAAYFGPRFTYDPVTLSALGLLIEEQRTNLLTYSEQVDNAAWVKTGCTITAGAIAAPDGNTTADLVVATGAPGSAYVQTSAPASTSGTATFSVYAKAGTRSAFNMTTFNGPPNTDFNLSTASKTDNNGAVGSITHVGGGWYRCVSTVTLGAPSTQRSFLWSIDGIYLWGAQLEAGAFATSYIPTTSASVTRAADSATMTGGNFSSWFNATQGTVVVEGVRTGAGSTRIAYEFCSASRGAGDVFAGDVGGSWTYYASGFAPQASVPAIWGVGTPSKQAASYKTNDFRSCVDGGAVQSDSSGTVTPGIDRLAIGGAVDGTQKINAPISRLRYYPTALTNAQLQALTT